MSPPVHSWIFPGGFHYAPQVEKPRAVPNLDAYDKAEEDPGVRLCRPCQSGDRVQGHLHACDGAPCECALCRTDELGFMDVVEEMSEYLAMREREDSWRDQR